MEILTITPKIAEKIRKKHFPFLERYADRQLAAFIHKKTVASICYQLPSTGEYFLIGASGRIIKDFRRNLASDFLHEKGFPVENLGKVLVKNRSTVCYLGETWERKQWALDNWIGHTWQVRKKNDGKL